MLLSDLVDEFLFDCKIRALSELTVNNYGKQFKKFLLYLETAHGVTELEQIRPALVKWYISFCKGVAAAILIPPKLLLWTAVSEPFVFSQHDKQTPYCSTLDFYNRGLFVYCCVYWFWLRFGHEKQIGQSGSTIAPKLIINVAISGSIQYVAGMDKAKTIMSVNKDSYAPIFDVSNYGAIADYKLLIPAIIKKIKSRKQRG